MKISNEKTFYGINFVSNFLSVYLTHIFSIKSYFKNIRTIPQLFTMNKKAIKISFLKSSLGYLKESREPKTGHKQPRGNWKNALLINNVNFETIIYKNANKEIPSHNENIHWCGIKKYEYDSLLSKNLTTTKSTIGKDLKFHLPDNINQKIDNNIIDAKEKNLSTFYSILETPIVIPFEKQVLKKSGYNPNAFFYINWVCEKVKYLSYSKTQTNSMNLCS